MGREADASNGKTTAETSKDRTMKRFLVGLGAAGVLSLLVSCVGISVGSGNTKRPPAPPPGSVVVVASEPTDAATIAEINAAAGLSFDNARADALTAIAQRPGLTPAAQVQLANTTYQKLSFDNQRVQVLLALISNPAFAPLTKQTIMAQLNKLSFDKDRQTILQAVNEREKTK